MEIILMLVMFYVDSATTTWTKYGATLENTHYQSSPKGAMTTAPLVKWSYKTGGAVETFNAVVGDINADGKMEVVFGSDDYKVYCLDGTTGALNWSYPTGSYVEGAAAIANVVGDGKMEVVFGSCDGKLYCLNGADAALKWSFKTSDQIECGPAVADIDGDGKNEVVFGGMNGIVYSVNGTTGAMKWWYQTSASIWGSSPAIADVNKDDTLEAVIGSEDYKVYCFNGKTGRVVWSYATGNIIYGSPAIADVNKDGNLEVVIGSTDGEFYCLDGATGAVDWSYGCTVDGSPAVADLDNDGTIEVVIGSMGGKIVCLEGGTGALKWSYTASGIPHRGITVADVDGDGKLEVLIPNNNAIPTPLVALNGEDGKVLWSKVFASNVYDVHDITAADIDLDGCLELVVGTHDVNTLWALDDISNSSDCTPGAVEEKGKESIDFKIIGNKIYLNVPGQSGKIPVNIKLYNLCGILKQVIYKGTLSASSHMFSLNIKENGIYFVNVRTPNYRETKKIVVVK